MKTLELVTTWDKEHVKLCFDSDKKIVVAEWKGAIPSKQLRDATVQTCDFVLEHDVELLLNDYTLLLIPNLEDQVWVANHAAELLQHSKIRKIANLMAQDLFQQIPLEGVNDSFSNVPLHSESRDFLSADEALQWLLSDA
ncbi:MAG: hypothetical protein LPJ89_04675 [Hymenobacteraceae bacterium]|nr:hypothetical protein [Hymenobacteraceae bacterium]